MAEITNRQVLINLHSATGEPTAQMLNFGEIAIKHSDATGATIFTRNTDGSVGKFITDLAVDAKVKVVADNLATHIGNYDDKVAELETADEDLNSAITSATTRIATLEDAVGVNGEGESLSSRMSAVEEDVLENANAITTETAARVSADTALGTRIDTVEAELETETAARESADTAIRTDFTAADSAIRADFVAADTVLETAYKAADDELLGVSGDTSAKTTIYGAFAAAAAAKKAADDADAAAEAAQTDADKANDAIAAMDATVKGDGTFVDVTVTQVDGKITDVTVAENDIASASALTAVTTRVATAETNITTLSANISDNYDTLNNAITAETAARESADTAIRTDFTAADTQIRIAFADADTVLETAYKAADDELLGVSGDTSAKTTIYGAFAAAAAADAAAAAAQTTANSAVTAAAAAQATADEVTEKFNTFMTLDDGETFDAALDTLKELQDYIKADADAANQMLLDITKNAEAADEAQATADSAVTAAAAAQATANQGVADAKKANDAIAAMGATVKGDGTFVDVTVTQVNGKITGVTVEESDIAKASDLTTLSNEVDVIEGAYVKAGEITTGNGTITGSVAGNKLTFDFANLVIDCGTF